MRPTRYRYLRVLLVLSYLALSMCGQPYQFHGTEIQPPNPAADFTLADFNGRPFRLSDQRGKVVLLFFGFTSCPDVCPTTLSEMQKVWRDLGSDAESVRFVMVTVDPDRDTPDRLRRYVTSFNPAFVGLHGSAAELEPIYKAYGVLAIKRELPNSALGYTMDHTASTFVIDRAGQWRLMLPYQTPVADILGDVRALARER